MATGSGGRIEVLDLVRGVALLAMASYHFTWDLEFFGYVESGTAGFGAWKLYARLIASTFLFLTGVSLFLAQRDGIRWPAFWRRLATIAAGAALVSIVTRIIMPDEFIFFGILHEIALASFLGLAFLRLPVLFTIATGAFVIALPALGRSEVFSHPVLWWIGLAPFSPRSNDYVPLFPWFGPVLLGIASARLAARFGLFRRLAALRFGEWSEPFRFAGRHGLAFYLLHQPLLIGIVWLCAQIVPPEPASREAVFIRTCQAQCAGTRSPEFCERYCGCMLDTLGEEELLDPLLAGKRDDELTSRVEDVAGECTVFTDARAIEEEEDNQ